MEQRISELEGVEDCVLVFETKQLRVTGENPDALLPEIREICSSIESEAKEGENCYAKDAEAVSRTRPRPARYAVRPASIACLNASAIAGISPAVAIAVLAMIAAAPISIASQACDGRPMPASTFDTVYIIENRKRADPSGQPFSLSCCFVCRYLMMFSHQRCMIAAISARVAVPVGARRPPFLPFSTPAPTAHCRAGIAYSLAC